jgi:hypothetical protein
MYAPHFGDELTQVPVAKSNLGEIFLGAISVPDMDVFVSQKIRVGGARDEPHCDHVMMITPFMQFDVQPNVKRQGLQAIALGNHTI